MSTYYTSQGDDGTTMLLGKNRVPKDHPRIRAVGAVDEVSAALGLARAQSGSEKIDLLIQAVQRDLYQLMSQLVLESPDPEKFPDLPPGRVTWLEEQIERFGEADSRHHNFILPGDNLASAAFSLSRTVTRRAEREVVALKRQGLLPSDTALPFLNRLSSLCYVLELYLVDHQPTLAKEDR